MLAAVVQPLFRLCQWEIPLLHEQEMRFPDCPKNIPAADEYFGRLSPVFRGSEPLFCSSLNRRFQIDRATYPMIRA